MKVQKFDSVRKTSSKSPDSKEEVSVLGVVGTFLMAVFRRKKGKRDKDGEKFSKDEQILSGIMASDELLSQVNNQASNKQI